LLLATEQCRFKPLGVKCASAVAEGFDTLFGILSWRNLTGFLHQGCRRLREVAGSDFSRSSTDIEINADVKSDGYRLHGRLVLKGVSSIATA
jgi:hypothetical protein